jgi:hypothetical protein
MARAISLAGVVLAIAAGAACGLAAAAPETAPPDLSLDVTSYAGPTPLRTTFSVTGRNGIPLMHHRWCFDDGTKSEDASPTHTFRRAGYYTVVIQTQDASGFGARESALLGVWPPWEWNRAQRRPITKESARRAQRRQQRRTDERRKRLRRRGGLTLIQCTRAPFP